MSPLEQPVQEAGATRNDQRKFLAIPVMPFLKGRRKLEGHGRFMANPDALFSAVSTNLSAGRTTKSHLQPPQ
jgi:hypothetical protein